MNRYHRRFFAVIASTLFISAMNVGMVSAQLDNPDSEKTVPSEPSENTVMTQAKIKTIISEIAEEVEEENGNLTFYYNGATLALLSDTSANRMRIVTPVIEATQLTQEQIISTLISNYHLALDARYAIGDGVLYSVYIHPLAELTETQLVSAVRQVATLRDTFGNGYTSGELSFGVQAEEERLDI